MRGGSGLDGGSGALGHTGSAQRPHGRALRADWRNRQPHPHQLAHVFQMAGFTWEYLGLREDFVHPGAQNPPRSPNTPEHGHHRTLVPHGTHSDLPRPAMRQNRVAAAPRLALLRVSGRFDGFRIVSGPDHRGRVAEPQSLTVASIVSRRAGRCSHLAWGTGVHPARAVPVRGPLKAECHPPADDKAEIVLSAGSRAPDRRVVANRSWCELGVGWRSVSGGVFEQCGEQVGEPGPEPGWVVVEEQFGGGAVVDGHDGPGESVGGLQGGGQAGAVDRGGQ